MESEEKTKRFEDFGLTEGILKDVADLGYRHPTPIQAECIPPALEGKDLIGLAQTGTGKTAAFGLPIIRRVGGRPEMSALVLAPTRELAQQIALALRDLGKSSGVNVAVIVGGIPIKQDYKALQSWPNILVATPGRLIDHIYSQSIVLSDIKVLAVDEADRMYDMGFMPQVNRIIEVLPENRQTLMFTATMPDEVERLVRRHMKSAVRIKIGATAPVDRAEQKLFHVQETDKTSLLLDLLRRNESRVLIFVRTKRKVDIVARSISAKRHRVARLHGDRSQYDREAAMAGFRNGKYRVLVATDIAARGIDVANIDHVINYDFPHTAEDYIHRIGRTARVAASGLATSFVTHSDKPVLARLEKMISEKLPLVRHGSCGAEDTAEPKSAPRRRRSRRGGRSRGGKGRSHSRTQTAKVR